MSGDRLRDRREIQELLSRRATASDRRDPEAMLACHTADSTDDHGSGRESARTFIEKMAATSYRDPDNGPQKHMIGNVLVDFVADDEAVVESYHLAYHRHGVHSGPTDNLIAGRYLDRVRRVDGQWLIADRTVVYDWSRTTTATDPTRSPAAISLIDLKERTPVELADLMAKQEITEVLYLRARAGDRRDHALALSCYHDGATEEHEGFTGPAAEFVLVQSAYAPGKVPPATSLVHLIANVLIELDGDEAAVESYHLCFMTGNEADTTIAGRYLDRFARRDGRWAITHRQVVFDWSRTEPGVERFWDRYPDQSKIAFGRLGPEDPLYSIAQRGVADA
ncbi:nuclear transport factor 2 family protein [Kribbella sp. NPDC058245]|uniref:nuclear transport factor 2 family protein n=1 Tax=Kribbella sp. NPDC058245 TaxID=3346399 RepID=UPI0036E4BEE5